MLLNLRYQFMARALNRAGVDVYHKVVATKAVEVAERSDAQAPIAFVFKEQLQKSAHFIRFDHSTGELYLRYAKGNRIEARNDTFAHDWYYPTHAMNKARKDRYEEIFGSEYGYHDGPEFELPDLEGVNSSDLDTANKAFDNCISQFVAADGWLWKRVQEPTFHLYRVNQGWKTTLSFAPNAKVGSDRRHFHFGLNQYNEMINWKARLSELTDRSASDDEFTAMDVYEPSIDGYALDLEFALVDLVERFSATSREIKSRPEDVFSLPEMPLPVIDAFVRARRILEIPREERGEDVHASTVALLESIPEIIKAYPRYNVLFAKTSENAFHVDKWHSRPISIVPILSTGPTP